MRCWLAIEADVRRAMLAAGRLPAAIDRALADLAPVYVAVKGRA